MARAHARRPSGRFSVASRRWCDTENRIIGDASFRRLPSSLLDSPTDQLAHCGLSGGGSQPGRLTNHHPRLWTDLVTHAPSCCGSVRTISVDHLTVTISPLVTSHEPATIPSPTYSPVSGSWCPLFAARRFLMMPICSLPSSWG